MPSPTWAGSWCPAREKPEGPTCLSVRLSSWSSSWLFHRSLKFVPIKCLPLVQIDVLFKPTKTKEPVAMAPQTIQTLESTCAKPSTSSNVKPGHHRDTWDQHQPACHKMRTQREAGKITHRRSHENNWQNRRSRSSKELYSVLNDDT